MAQPETIHRLMRQAARWAIAAEQDRAPVIRVLHANYAMSSILALREVASDVEVYRVTGYNPHIMFLELLDIQDRATRAVMKLCPELIPGPAHLARIAGEG